MEKGVRIRHRKCTHGKPWVYPATVPASFERLRSRFDANMMLFSPHGGTNAIIADRALNLHVPIYWHSPHAQGFLRPIAVPLATKFAEAYEESALLRPFSATIGPMKEWLSEAQKSLVGEVVTWIFGVILVAVAALWKQIISCINKEKDRKRLSKNVFQKRVEDALEWKVNPHWVYISDGKAVIKGYENKILLNRGASFNQMMSLYNNSNTSQNFLDIEKVESAKVNKHWLFFDERNSDGNLYLSPTTEPCGEDEKHLFKPVAR